MAIRKEKLSNVLKISLMVVSVCFLLWFTISLVYSRQEEIDTNFKTEMTEIYTSFYDINDDNYERFVFYMNNYMRNSESAGGFPIKGYSTNAFKYYLKLKDYDFYEKIKLVWEAEL